MAAKGQGRRDRVALDLERIMKFRSGGLALKNWNNDAGMSMKIKERRGKPASKAAISMKKQVLSLIVQEFH
jgi:hypothetical protein